MGRDVHSLTLSIQHFLCRPRRRLPSNVPWRMVLERLSWRVTCPNYSSFRLLTVARRGSCGPTRKLLSFRTQSLVLCSKQEMRISCNADLYRPLHFEPLFSCFIASATVWVRRKSPSPSPGRGLGGWMNQSYNSDDTSWYELWQILISNGEVVEKIKCGKNNNRSFKLQRMII